MQLGGILIRGLVERVHQVVVEIIYTQLLQLALERLALLLFGVQHHDGQLGSDGVLIAGIALHQHLFQHLFTLEVVIHPGCIKVGEPTLYERVHHALNLFLVKARLISGVEQWQPHAAKS